MELKRGLAVRIAAGHDKGRFCAVLAANGARALIADGRTRTIAFPKRKNPIHLRPTATVLSEEELQSNQSLRRALEARFGAQGPSEGGTY